MSSQIHTKKDFISLYNETALPFGQFSVEQLTERINTDTLRFLYLYDRLQAVLALPLGELSPQVTERVLQNDQSAGEDTGHFPISCYLLVWSCFALSVLALLGHLSRRARQGGLAPCTKRCTEVRLYICVMITVLRTPLFRKAFSIIYNTISAFVSGMQSGTLRRVSESA